MARRAAVVRAALQIFSQWFRFFIDSEGIFAYSVRMVRLLPGAASAEGRSMERPMLKLLENHRELHDPEAACT
jgi:hypothetical protein